MKTIVRQFTSSLTRVRTRPTDSYHLVRRNWWTRSSRSLMFSIQVADGTVRYPRRGFERERPAIADGQTIVDAGR